MSTKYFIYGIVTLYVAAAAGLFANLFTTLDPLQLESGTSRGFLLAWVVLYAVSLPFILSQMRPHLTTRGPVVLVLIVLALSGYLWSAMPGQTLRYSASLGANIAFAWFCARRLSLREFLQTLRWAVTAMTVIGLVLAAAGVSSAYWYDGLQRHSLLGLPPIQGLFSHKIYAGFYGAVAMALHIYLGRGSARFGWAAVMLLAVLLSGSSVALSAALIAMITMVLLPKLRRPQLRILAVIAAVPVLAGVAYLSSAILETSTAALGRDVTLTGRTEMWDYALQFWAERPLLGWAYGGIFGDASNAPGNIVKVGGYWQAPHFHNGFLQVAAELGAVGLLIYAAILFTALGGALSLAWDSRRPEGFAAATILIMISTIAVVMNIGMRYNELSTVLVFYFFLAMPDARPQLKAAPATVRRATERFSTPAGEAP